LYHKNLANRNAVTFFRCRRTVDRLGAGAGREAIQIAPAADGLASLCWID
jgi:hypothetical protein